MAEPFSAVVITLNAASHLERCLETISFANEIVVVDSGSNDGTLDIARRFGATVVSQSWLGFGPQKNLACTLARYPWVLSVDADEQVSPELRKSILVAMESPHHRAYAMPRCNRFMGHWLRHGEGYPDICLRFFHRDHAQWSSDPVHEKVVTKVAVGRLSGDLLHESEQTIAAYLTKQNRYTTLQAEQLFAKGKRAGWGKICLSPFFRFLKFYVLRLGFLDGIPGLIHIGIGCFNSFSKYAKLRELSRTGR